MARHGDRARPPRMTDVAQIAGVSHQTVSRVLNNYPGIRPETRQRVLDAIAQLGYRRNMEAKRLASHRSGLVGLIASRTEQFGPAHVILGIQDAAARSPYTVSVVTLREPSQDSFHSAVDRLLEQSVEALIVLVPQVEVMDLMRSLNTGVPVVSLEGDLSGAPLTASVDQVRGGRIATEHLLHLGHRTVAHVSGPTDWFEAQGRKEGWELALSEKGAPVPGTCLSGDWSARSGYQAGLELAKDLRTTAIFAGNDQMALGLIRAMQESGRKVPDEISIVGFDDLPETPYYSPPLTTVRQDFDELGRHAMTLTERLLSGEDEAQVPMVAPTLVVRKSTAPPPDGTTPR